jgi:imidazolonepropionase-like amidohydrolase
MRDRIPNEVFAAMAKSGVAYDPTLSVAEAFLAIAEGKTDLLDRSLVAQAVPNKLLQNTKKMINSPQMAGLRESIKSYPIRMDVARDNLVRAWKAGVMLVTGSDAGNMLVLHGPTVQHELQLWVEAGIPASVALQAATNNAAKLLRIENRVGLIRNGYDATLLLVDGNPLQDISATERISIVFYKGERVDRGSLFDQ